MSELWDIFKDIDMRTEDLSDVCEKLIDDWDALLHGLPANQDGLEPWDSVQFKRVVLETYEYFKTFYERTNMFGEGLFRVPLGTSEMELMAMVYAYGTAEIFCPRPYEDEDAYYLYASYFIAAALYETITYSNLGIWADQELYTLINEFKYCSPDGEDFLFKYNVKTGNMAEIVNLIKMFDELGWLDERHRHKHIYTLPDPSFIEELKKSFEDGDE